MKYSVMFVGAFDLTENKDNKAASAAGNQVQVEIANAITDSLTSGLHSFHQTVLKPLQSWPRGRLLYKGESIGNADYPSLINIAWIKRINFSIILFFKLISKKPNIVIKYNLSLSESISLLLYKALFPSAFTACIIQDVHHRPGRVISLRQLSELLSMKLATRFDLLMPISMDICNDFRFPPEKTIIFSGGLTRQGRHLLNAPATKASNHFVFAGALEKYNGVHLIIKQWISQKIAMELHIFGRGSLESFVREAAGNSDRIVFHGFQSEDVVSKWQASSAGNFCLRYDDGINSGYFFPSKLFNIICAPGAVLINKFKGFPADLQSACKVLNDDLSDLRSAVMELADERTVSRAREHRTRWLLQNADWINAIAKILDRATKRNLHKMP